jgi:hypothetical protein
MDIKDHLSLPLAAPWLARPPLTGIPRFFSSLFFSVSGRETRKVGVTAVSSVKRRLRDLL